MPFIRRWPDCEVMYARCAAETLSVELGVDAANPRQRPGTIRTSGVATRVNAGAARIVRMMKSAKKSGGT